MWIYKEFTNVHNLLQQRTLIDQLRTQNSLRMLPNSAKVLQARGNDQLDS